MNTDYLSLSDLTVDTTIHNVTGPRTRLVVGVDLHLDLEMAGRTDDFAHTIDYFQVTEIIESFARYGKWSMLESLALALARTLLLPPAPGESRAPLEAVTLRMSRPALLGGRATPGLVLHRERRWCATERRVLGPGAAADIIAETRFTDVLRVRLTAGSSLDLPAGSIAVPLANISMSGESHASATTGPGVLLLLQSKRFDSPA